MITINRWATDLPHKDRYFIKADGLPSMLLYRTHETEFWYMHASTPRANYKLESVELREACGRLKSHGYLGFTPKELANKQYMDVVHAYIDLLHLNNQTNNN